MRLCKEIVAAIPKDRLPITCMLNSGAYYGSYEWLIINKDLSFEHRVERYGAIISRAYSFDKVNDAFLLPFDYNAIDLAITARFHIWKSHIRKALTKYDHSQEFAPRALGLALSSNRMDMYLSGHVVELLRWLKDNNIKYSLDIKIIEE